MKRKHIFWLASLLGLAFALVQSVAFIRGREEHHLVVAATGVKPKQQVEERARHSDQESTFSRVALHAAGRGNPWINLRDGHDLLTSYTGTGLEHVLESQAAQPLALAAGDFDEDGVPDLLSGYAGAGKGILTLHRGNVDLLFPNNLQSKKHNSEATTTVSDAGTIDRSVPAYFLAAARVFDLPEPADFLGAGDFDADGHWDVVAAAHGSNKLAGIMMSSGAEQSAGR